MIKTTSIQKRKTLPSIEKNMYINELLPESEASIANEAKKSNMIVSIHNCVVSVLVENGINKPKFMRVNELEDPDKVKAIKRKQNYDNEKPDNRSEENITSPPKKRQFICRQQ